MRLSGEVRRVVTVMSLDGVLEHRSRVLLAVFPIDLPQADAGALAVCLDEDDAGGLESLLDDIRFAPLEHWHAIHLFGTHHDLDLSGSRGIRGLNRRPR